MSPGRFFAACAVALVACAAGARAADAPPNPVVTQHRVTLGGKPIAYAARAGTITLRDEHGDPTAEVFSVAYVMDGADRRTRPVTFVWNGGPGSSTMWLHMASYGPLRVAIPSDARIPDPRTPLEPNAESLIDTTDLVFIDAVGTGYSRIVGKGKPETFYGVDEDARAFADVIRAWVTDNDRWASPKFLFGESYGTTRAANVVNVLQRDGMGIDGVVLLSSALDFNQLDVGQGPGEDDQFVGFLPTEAAVAWYHKALPQTPPALPPFLDEVRAFAEGPYAAALMAGDALPAATRREIVAKLHGYTGLDAAYIDRANLRLDPGRFEHELLHARGEATGRIDARYVGPELDRTADSPSYDPSTDDGLTDAIVGAFTRYVREDLNYRVDRPYRGTNYREIGGHWKYRREHSVLQPNTAGDLREAMTKNPYLRVFSANGWFDLATPFFGTEYTLSHLALAPALRSHVEYGFYPSGHMVYLNDEARRAFKADLVRFYREAVRR